MRMPTFLTGTGTRTRTGLRGQSANGRCKLRSLTHAKTGRLTERIVATVRRWVLGSIIVEWRFYEAESGSGSRLFSQALLTAA